MGTLPETNVAPENRPKPNRKVVFQPSICRGELLVLGSVTDVTGMIFHVSTPPGRRHLLGYLSAGDAGGDGGFGCHPNFSQRWTAMWMLGGAMTRTGSLQYLEDHPS